MGLLDREAARFGAAAAKLAKDVADRNRAHLRAWHPGNFEHRHAAARGLKLELDFLVVELAGAQLLAKGVLGGRACILANQSADDALLGVELGARLHVLAPALASLGDSD